MSVDLAALSLDEVLAAGRRLNASDIHLAVGQKVLFRIDGNLCALEGDRCTVAEVGAIARKLVSKRALHQLRHQGDVDVAFEHALYGRMRVHALRTTGQIALCIRLLADEIPALHTLGLPGMLHECLRARSGLIIISGPTGSGKTTVLASLLDAHNAEYPDHIITIEDPIEYLISSRRSRITQREVGQDVPNFSAGIIQALRCDPNVLSVGELLHASTMTAALRAAETGHLVLATIHSTDAKSALERIIDAHDTGRDVIRRQLAAVLRAVVAVRLVPARHGGRILVSELLVANDAVRTLIREERFHQIPNILATGRAQGMQSLAMHLAELRAIGSIAEVNDAHI